MSEKKLGFGLMRLPSLTRTTRARSTLSESRKWWMRSSSAASRIDTAWMYCAFKSENAVKEALFPAIRATASR